jgi:hypothetical protein
MKQTPYLKYNPNCPNCLGRLIIKMILPKGVDESGFEIPSMTHAMICGCVKPINYNNELSILREQVRNLEDDLAQANGQKEGQTEEVNVSTTVPSPSERTLIKSNTEPNKELEL